jgi:putative heme-binding domain-containing protein
MKPTTRWSALVFGLLASGVAFGQQPAARREAGAPQVRLAAQDKAAAGGGAVPRPSSTPAARIKAPKGFRVELLYSVPKDSQGSWVNMAIDPKGRLTVSDQYGKLYTVTLPALDGANGDLRVEPIAVDIAQAQGLLWAFDSLYVVVNGERGRNGLYRVRDTNADEKLDKAELLGSFDGGGEHGPHGIVLSPDGTSLYLVAGNATRLPKIGVYLEPPLWGEDNILPHLVDGGGFMTNEKAPGGYVVRVQPDGSRWDLVASGFRNAYDLAFSREGELFTYDSDMEWDVSLPWYRPTRVLHVVSGAEFGYRNGSGKWPAYTIDSLPPVVNVGPGSPTGITFGYGAKFPAKYERALYVSDWSYGKLYALHLKPSGASYTGELEEFVAGTPLALTDVVVNPNDGAMYFTVGGRRTQSGLYRVTYVGDEPIGSQAILNPLADEMRDLRHRLEAFHGKRDDQAVDTAWPFLGHTDRFIRWAARVAIEAQDPATWSERALNESSSAEATLNALLALTHVSARDLPHRVDGNPVPDPKVGDQILSRLDRIGWDGLTHAEKLDLLRVYEVVLARFERPSAATIDRLIARFDRYYPAASSELNSELCQLLVFLESPTAAAKTIALLERAPTQEEQIDYARDLRMLKSGWTTALRRSFFQWLQKANEYTGGNSFRGFMTQIRRAALDNLSGSERDELKDVIDALPTRAARAPVRERPFVKAWTAEELATLLDGGLRGRDFDRGRTVFGEAKCFACHRFGTEGGGLGPDLTGVAGRFGIADLIDSIVRPSKTISDQYEAVTIATTNGRVITGRIVNLNGDNLMVSTDMLAPNKMENVRRDQIDEMKASPVSMMPEGLLNTLNRDEVLDLFAYLLSRGDRESPMFSPRAAAGDK